MRWQWGAAIGLIVALAAVAAFALAADRRQPTAVLASPSPTQAVSSPTPAPSPSPSPAPVLPDNDVDDPVEALRAIEAYRDYLFANPDPQLVRFIYHPDCGCTAPLEELLAEMVAAGERAEFDGTSEVVGPHVERQDERIAVVEYRIQLPRAHIFDSAGNVVEEQEATLGPLLRVSVARDGDGRWLVTFAQEVAE